MGLTIHYRLHADTTSADEARRLVEQLRAKALALPFQEVGELTDLGGDQADPDKLDRDDPNRWLLIQAGEYVERGGRQYPVTPDRLIAFSAWPGEGCEEANFGLALYPKTIEVGGRRVRTGLSGWSWSSFCKNAVRLEPGLRGAGELPPLPPGRL